MAWPRKAVIWMLVGTTAGIIAAAIVIVPKIGTVKFITGAVLIADTDTRKQLPIPNAEICGEVGERIACTRSDATGFFRLTWPGALWWGQSVRLTFKHASYQPQTVAETLTHQIYLARLPPASASQTSEADGPITNLANLRVRYSVKSTNTVDVGSMVKTLEVFNAANVPCSGKVCSPDGRFAAMVGSFEMDAGPQQEFQNARISCLAGPCPFTRVEKDDFSRGGRVISGRVRVWADTATFLVEADVVRTALSDVIRQSYPSIFGRSMTFTLPPNGQGPSIQADVDGSTIVFPLGPALILSWATCNVQTTANHSKLYRCVLNPGYRFH
jgi:hypothetical protein